MKKKISIEDNELIIKINKNIYNKEILIHTSYIMLEKNYILIDENENNFIIYISYKNEKENTKEKLEQLAYEFFDELIESSAYLDQLKRTSKTREIILEKALISQKSIDINK
jgi:His-Xaa-Ser system protein HxsD